RTFLRSFASACLLFKSVSLPMVSKALRHSSSCSTYRPLARQYSARSACFMAAVLMTTANLDLVSHLLGVVFLFGTIWPFARYLFRQLYRVALEMPYCALNSAIRSL